MVLSNVIVEVIWWSMSVMEWPGGLKCKGIAAVALAWSGLSFACMFFTKRSRSVRLVSPLNILFLHLLHSIRNVKLVEVQVMRCFIRERFKEQATNNLPIPNWLTSLCILMPQMVAGVQWWVIPQRLVTDEITIKLQLTGKSRLIF